MGKGRRWMLQDAIEGSDLAPFIRLILLSLLGRADAVTGIIPASRQPSYAELVRCTGMRRQDIGKALAAADKHGWLLRKRGGGRGGAATQYTVKLPSEPTP